MYKPPTKEFICKNCSETFTGERRRNRTVCSLKCSAEFNIKNNPNFGFKKGHKKRLGVKHPQSFIENRKGIGNPAWKGDNVKFSSMHCWIRENFKKNKRCEFCGKEGRTDWSHKTHKYTKTRNEWQELCRSCHQKYDHKNGLRKLKQVGIK